MHLRTYWACIVIVLAPLAACSSSHNFKTDGHSMFGGGFADEEIQPGLNEMTATGNFAPWPSFGAAAGTWKTRADQLCGKGAHLEIVMNRDAVYRAEVSTYTGLGKVISLPKFNATMSGYVLCNSSSMTRSDAIKYLEELPVIRAKEFALNQKVELDLLGGGNCASNNDDDSAETYYRRGKILMELNDYKSAMLCFLQSQERESNTNVYRESCSSIGMMYELGWGIDKDIPTAKAWYKKAGL